MTQLQALLGQLPQLVMYDLDGTLVDSVPGVAEACDRMLTDLSQPVVGEARVRTWVGGGQKMLVRQALDEAGLPEATMAQALASFRRHYADTSTHRLRLFPGVQALLDFFAGQAIPQVVVTNKPIEFVPDMLELLGIERYFVGQLGGECLATRKPDPLMLNTMLERFSVAPEKALMVGDSNNDLEAAARAGVPALAVTYGYHRGADLGQFNPVWQGNDLSVLINPV